MLAGTLFQGFWDENFFYYLELMTTLMIELNFGLTMGKEEKIHSHYCLIWQCHHHQSQTFKLCLIIPLLLPLQLALQKRPFFSKRFYHFHSD